MTTTPGRCPRCCFDVLCFDLQLSVRVVRTMCFETRYARASGCTSRDDEILREKIGKTKMTTAFMPSQISWRHCGQPINERSAFTAPNNIINASNSDYRLCGYTDIEPGTKQWLNCTAGCRD